MTVVYITILLIFIDSSVGFHHSNDLEEQLMEQEKTIQTLLRLLQQPCYLINPRQTRHHIPGSILPMTIHQKKADAGIKRNKYRPWRRNPIFRFGSDRKTGKSSDSKSIESVKKVSSDPEFDNDFYRALSKILKMEINRRPELKKVIGDDIKKINIGKSEI
ncbi:GSCOCG00005256001-RA-CDS [Cotesia congregata]|uniref:Uncharacterized protein n=1 Tax=Cotesia congregata TaxID=51543 RepID=A0A8J2HPR3_COTCN|nr:GSCOCG00005256001-RA-CDS [Cotesia congregata]CAG5101780.1 Protein of unknown function [Cotesia congregata]